MLNKWALGREISSKLCVKIILRLISVNLSRIE